MARIRTVVGVLRALGLVSWREIRSIGSISGQNLFLFVLFLAMQPQSAEFFGMIFAVVLIFPLLSDPLQKIPRERRISWPILKSEWRILRLASLGLSPIAWLAVFLLIRAGWRSAAEVVGLGVLFYTIKWFTQLLSRKVLAKWELEIPAPPGITGALMRLHLREMLATLDPYVAFGLMAVTALYRIFGKGLDPSALRIMSLVVALAISTEAQVLFSLDGRGADRYRQLPLRGWQILVAKDLAFLAVLALLVMPLDPLSGWFGGLAALGIGHNQSVVKPIPQARWRFTSGAIFPDGLLQTLALFAVGSAVREQGLLLMPLCILAWFASLIFYGRQWDRQAL